MTCLTGEDHSTVFCYILQEKTIVLCSSIERLYQHICRAHQVHVPSYKCATANNEKDIVN